MLHGDSNFTRNIATRAVISKILTRIWSSTKQKKAYSVKFSVS